MNIDRFFNRKTDKFECFEIDVFSASDSELVNISNKMGLALALPEMKNIQSYFKNKNRLPTDIELQALGQAWSEHCCYKSSKIPLKKYLFGISEDKIITREDAGIIEFDKDHYYCAALESHNHPSAVEPYGGAATGVGGIVRDVLCMGAQPIAYIDPLFFGPLDLPQKKLPKGVKHPRFLFKGVVDGIRDYGNRIGIPTLSGQVYFHEGYTSNCLVNVGCIGILKKEELIHSRAKAPGNIYIYVGGKTGRDGIHGVTFASAELKDDSEESSRSAVQVGDPITKEPVIHATLECNRKGLLEGLKDFGGGGLSCVSGELAYAAGYGAEIILDNIPLKEEGLSPWEIWISESQERMMFLVTPKNVEEVLHICKQWDITASVVGKVIEEKITRVIYKGVKILEMDMDFFTGGPEYDTCQRPFIISKQKENIDNDFEMPNLNEIIKKLLGNLNIASKEWVIHQYDHEVRGNTVIKPLQGKINFETHGDATVLKPLEDSFRGLAVTANINPRFMERDPYLGARSAIDETCRNLISVGAKPDSLLDCLNFGNPEKSEKMGEFYEACRGLGDAARELSLPFISGNVSFYNESVKTAVPPTPQILGIGIIPDIRKCVTSDFKKQNNLIYIIGKETEKEMGGSEYYNTIKVNGGIVPKTDINLLKNYMKGILNVIDKKLIVSCHDISEGGLAVCISEMCIGGGIGAQVNLSNMSKNLRSDIKLFSESNTRWIIEVEKVKQKELEKKLKENNTPFTKIGEIKSDKIMIENNGKKIIDQKICILKDIWKNTIRNMMG